MEEKIKSDSLVVESVFDIKKINNTITSLHITKKFFETTDSFDSILLLTPKIKQASELREFSLDLLHIGIKDSNLNEITRIIEQNPKLTSLSLDFGDNRIDLKAIKTILDAIYESTNLIKIKLALGGTSISIEEEEKIQNKLNEHITINRNPRQAIKKIYGTVFSEKILCEIIDASYGLGNFKPKQPQQ